MSILGLSPAIFWIIVMVIAIVIEIATLGLTSIWFAGGALVAVGCALLHVPFIWQVLICLIVSTVLLVFTRPIVSEHFNRNRTATNVESLIGESAVVIEEISNIKQTGRVSIQGKEWTARTENQEAVIAKDKIVTIQNIEGVKLIVKERKEEL